MVRLGLRSKHGPGGGFDTISYMTDTSSITNPVELGFSYSQEHDEDEDVSYFENDYSVAASSALTGWTTEAEESAFPVAHSKTAISQQTSYTSGGSYENDEIGTRISAISFDDLSVEASLMGKKSKQEKGKKPPPIRAPLSEMKSANPTKAVKFLSPTNASPRSSGPTSPGSISSNTSRSSSKQRKPVPPLRDPTMEDKEEDQMWEEDCNYDINPTAMFSVLESNDWNECIALLDGKSSNSWNLNHLFGGGKPDVSQMKARQKELRAQARTWIVRRQKTGVLRWRMLPFHAALAFNAPFDIVLRIYHLYPGAVRCRNDQGMLPIHHAFYYGNEDRVLELLLDVYPEGLTVTDDKGRLPIASTPRDGSDNDRRSNILNLYCNFQISQMQKELQNNAAHPAQANQPVAPMQSQQHPHHQIKPGFLPQTQQEQQPQVRQQQAMQNYQPRPMTAAIQTQPRMPLPQVPQTPQPEAALGIAPRYAPTNSDYSNPASYNSIPNPPPKAPEISSVPERSDEDRYALTNEENSSLAANKLNGLAPIPEDEETSDKEPAGSSEKKVRKGFRKLLRKMK